MENILVIVGFILSIVGVIGFIITGIPGPPLNLIAVILIKVSYADQVSWLVLILFGLLTLAVTILDYAIPMIGGKLFKASRSGIIGSTIGMFIGIFIFEYYSYGDKTRCFFGNVSVFFTKSFGNIKCPTQDFLSNG